MVKPDIPLKLATFLLPSKKNLTSSWPVIASDQYSSNELYWQKVRDYVKGQDSSLNYIIPQNDLLHKSSEYLKAEVNQNMENFMLKGEYEQYSDGLFLIERTLASSSKKRHGVLMLIDLEQYDYRLNPKSLIRPTEKTIEQRLPLKVKLRQNSNLELSHVILFYDDPSLKIMENLQKADKNLIYDIKLMENSGRVKGYFYKDTSSLCHFIFGLRALLKKEVYQKKYSLSSIDSNEAPLLFAVGDGNHTLAAASIVWEDYKKLNPSSYDKDHPLRYALVEVQNIHDPSIEFYGIHRVLFHTELDSFLDFFKKKIEEAHVESVKEDDIENIRSRYKDRYTYEVKALNKNYLLIGPKKDQRLPSKLMEELLDNYLSMYPSCKIDYIHDKKELERLCAKDPSNIGIFLESPDKKTLFESLIKNGTAPRKSFSVGNADDKRFYLEMRSLKKCPI